MVICVLSRVIFTSGHSWSFILFSQFLAGICNGFSLLTCLRLATDWFPSEKQAQVIGSMVTIGLLGGVIAQTPFVLLINSTSYEFALWANVIIGIIFLLLMYFLVRDKPTISNNITLSTLIKNLKTLAINKQNWLCGIYTSLLNLTVTLLGTLWGSLYLIHKAHFSNVQASLITSMIFLGMMVGSPLIGFISDRLGKRRLPMISGSISALGLILIIMYIPTLSFFSAIILFFLLGFVSSAQVISYTIIVKSNLPSLASTATSTIALWVNVVTALLQPLFGWLVMINFSHGNAISYHLAMLILPIAFIVSLLAAFFIVET
jgi:MFS family permease